MIELRHISPHRVAGWQISHPNCPIVILRIAIKSISDRPLSEKTPPKLQLCASSISHSPILSHAKSNSARTQKGTSPNILHFTDNADIVSTWTNVSLSNLTAHEKSSAYYEDMMYKPPFFCAVLIL